MLALIGMFVFANLQPFIITSFEEEAIWRR